MASGVPSATPVLELESLFVRIYADATQYLGTVPVVKKATDALNASIMQFEKIANSASNAFNKLAKGSMPVPPELNRVSRSASDASQKLGVLSTRGMGVYRTFMLMRLAVAGFATFSLYEFGKVDDILTRSMTHMNDWGSKSRSMLEKSVLGLSMRSTSSAGDLASAQDTLIRGGFNPAAAMRALAVTEDMAVASGMNVKDTAEKQMEILNSLGLVTNDVNKNIKEMTQLSDLLTGTANATGSSVEKLAQALGPRFAVEMSRNNIALKDGVALLGAFSLRGMRGAEGGEEAARFLAQMSKAAIQHNLEWARLGVSVYSNGQMRAPLEILSQLDARMKSMSPEVQRATLYWLGFERQGVAAASAVLGMSEQFKQLIDMTGGMEGFTHAAAEMVRRDFLSQLKILWNNLADVGYVIGRSLAPGIASIAQGIGTLSGWFVNVNPAVSSFIVMLGMVAGGLLLVNPALKLAAWGFASLVRGMMLPLRIVQSVFSAVTGVFYGIYSAITGVLASIARVALAVAGDIWGGFWEVFGMVKKFLLSLGTITTDVFTKIIEFLLDIPLLLLNIIPLLITIAMFVLGFAGLVTLVSTIGIGIGQFFAMIVGGIAAAWDGVKDNLSHVGDWLAGQTDAVVGMWEAAKNAVADYFDTAVIFGDKLIGFFWNFGENMITIWRWIGRNWRPLVNDIGTIMALLVEGIIANVKELGKFILSTGSIAWNGFFSIAAMYMEPVFTTIRDQWDNILHDMGLLFKSFIHNLASNLMVVLSMMGSLASVAGQMTALDAAEINRNATTSLRLGVGILSPLQAAQEINQTHADIRARKDAISSPILAEMMSQMKGPLDGLDRTQFKTNFGSAAHFEDSPTGIGRFEVPGTGIFAGLERANSMAAGLIHTMGVDIGNRWSSTKISNPLENFVSTVKEDLTPLLKLEKPPDWQNRVEGMLRNMMGVGRGEGEGMVSGERGPGFKFQQISTARYMIGGPAMVALDRQQLVTLENIDQKLETINTSINNTKQGPPPPVIRR